MLFFPLYAEFGQSQSLTVFEDCRWIPLLYLAVTSARQCVLANRCNSHPHADIWTLSNFWPLKFLRILHMQFSASLISRWDIGTNSCKEKASIMTTFNVPLAIQSRRFRPMVHRETSSICIRASYLAAAHISRILSLSSAYRYLPVPYMTLFSLNQSPCGPYAALLFIGLLSARKDATLVACNGRSIGT